MTRPRAKHDDLVGHRHRLLQIVHDQDDGLSGVASAPDLIEHLLGLADGERGRRLIENQAARAVDDRPRDRDGLLLAAGQCRRRVAQPPPQIDAERGQGVGGDAIGRLRVIDAQRSETL